MKVAILSNPSAVEHFVTFPDPLVPIGPRPMIDHVLAAVQHNGLGSVTCLLSEGDDAVEEYCRKAWPELCVQFIHRRCAGWVDGLCAVAPCLAERSVLLTTDCIYPADLLHEMVAASTRRPNADAVLAVCSPVGEADPLWVDLHCDGRILSVGSEASHSRLVAAGIFVLEPRTFSEIAGLQRSGGVSLESFLTHLLHSGYRVYGERVPHGIPLETEEDLATAATLLED